MTTRYNQTKSDRAKRINAMKRRLKARPAPPETGTHPDVDEGPGKYNDHMGDRDCREHTVATSGCGFLSNISNIDRLRGVFAEVQFVLAANTGQYYMRYQ